MPGDQYNLEHFIILISPPSQCRWARILKNGLEFIEFSFAILVTNGGREYNFFTGSIVLASDRSIYKKNEK